MTLILNYTRSTIQTNEVEKEFINYLIPHYTPLKENKSQVFIADLTTDVRQGRPEQFMTRLQTLFAGNDYRVAGDMEKYFSKRHDAHL